MLAGGASSRMGRDKALLELAGKPLVEHAVGKLQSLCREVTILSARPELARFGRLLPDRYPRCGPLGGMEAALADTPFEWNLFLPVDVPFLPEACLAAAVDGLFGEAAPKGARLLFWMAHGRPQPTVALIHREIGPQLTAALEAGRFRLVSVLTGAAEVLARREGRCPASGFWPIYLQAEQGSTKQDPEFAVRLREGTGCEAVDSSQSSLWFANLNTPEDFDHAVRAAAIGARAEAAGAAETEPGRGTAGDGSAGKASRNEDRV